MPDDSQYDRNMKHLLTRVIQFVVVDGSTYVIFIILRTVLFR
jgi:hypothetical protein